MIRPSAKVEYTNGPDGVRLTVSGRDLAHVQAVFSVQAANLLYRADGAKLRYPEAA